jgi:hypothetical protein
MEDLIITLGMDKQTLRNITAKTSHGCYFERTETPVVQAVPEKLVCDDCRATYPSLLACAHTLPPRIAKGKWRAIPDRNIEEEAKELQSIMHNAGGVVVTGLGGQA